MENFLAADVFRPERIVFLCPSNIAQSRSEQKKITDYISWRGMGAEAVFLDTSLLHTDKVYRQLENVTAKFPDCAIDITGGSDAALFAAGQFCAVSGTPAFTYSRKKHRFFNIDHAEFAENVRPELTYRVEDYLRMAGGEMKSGRMATEALDRYLTKIDPFFRLFMKNRKQWGKFVTWFQRASQQGKNEHAPSLHVDALRTLKGERGSRVSIEPEFLKSLEKLEFLYDLVLTEERVSFQFADSQTRFWLRDAGSVLELYTWKACRDTGIFNDVLCSTIVRWESSEKETVTNEIDVTASCGIVPVFISCKTCVIDTDALNELAILKDHFGGYGAKAIIVSTENSRPITSRRASALGIDMIELNDLKRGKLSEQIREYLKTTN